MTPYSDAELDQMLDDLESDSVERKRSLSDDAATKVREAICAFANDLPGRAKPGVVIVGACDDGTPSNLPITDELLKQLADMKSDGNIVPPPTLTVAPATLRGARMAVVTVWPSDSPPVRFKGRIMIRTGPRRGVATAQDERILNERRRHRDRPFDLWPVPSATIADLDRRRFEEEYLPRAVAPDILAANERSYEQRLAASKMIRSVDEPAPTVLGVLVLAPSTRDFMPSAYVQFLRVQGTDMSDPVVDEQVIDGTVTDTVRRLEEKLDSHNRATVNFTSGPVELRGRLFPPVALQQIVRNAIMHRTYEATNAPVRVTWYDDRIEIVSPGGPFGVVTVDNFGEPGASDYRNPSLAEAMLVLGLVQRFGAGIATARRAMREAGHPEPEFTLSPTHVAVTLRVRP